MGTATSTSAELGRLREKTGRAPTAVETKQVVDAAKAYFSDPSRTTEMPAGWRPGAKAAPSKAKVTAKAPTRPPTRPSRPPSRPGRRVGPTTGYRGGGRSRSPHPQPHTSGPRRSRPRVRRAEEGAVVTGSSNPVTGTGSGEQKSQAAGNLAKGFGGK